ncbi:PDDEXK nuclease domain-containing protein [Ferruginibacter sp. SUN106]|uniref:PDDEXK nuclease domain-containing protein n=1 Tax=Ferruginibacter sp. SUN106 TaxID=2978348 RepID=UPI003D362197
MSKVTTAQLFKNIKTLVEQSKRELYVIANTTLTETYFHIGRLIVEYEQQGNNRAEYAKETLINLSAKLTAALGKGFSVDNLENMRKFYVVYKDDYLKHIGKNQKSETVSRKLSLSPFKLSWSHYIFLSNIENTIERKFYTIEANTENWSFRELKRQYESALFERLALSRNKAKVKELSKKGQVIEKPSDAVKDPYILEFLDLHEQDFYSESDLEKAIINKLEHFLLELGKGFLFVDRQKRIKMDGDDYKIDLVFYHRILRCFVLIDLKIGTLQHKDLGQMQMYVNYYDEEIKAEEENKTIGIILCKNKKESTIKYTLGKGNKQIFASKYRVFFPEKQILKLIREQ